VLRDRLVERDQVPVASALRDPLRRDHLSPRATRVGAEVDHRDRLQARKELPQRRAPHLPLAPAEEDVADLRVLPGVGLEAVRVPRDPEQRTVRARPAGRVGDTGGEGERREQQREQAPPHAIHYPPRSDGWLESPP
jgi:hypothetical protein